MNNATATVHIDCADITVQFHCNHDNDAASWRVSATGDAVTVYLTGNAEQLSMFACLVARAAAEYAFAQLAAATS